MFSSIPSFCVISISLYFLATFLYFFLTQLKPTLPFRKKKNLCVLLTSKQVYKLIQRAVILKIFYV